MKPIDVKRSTVILDPDRTHVLARPFNLVGNHRSVKISARVMALFPRKINGLYAMLGRQDAENIYVMFSDDLHFWHTMQLILEPAFPWEFIQLGNCGSPIETAAGWLVISHGVGAMRKYCIGASLLDRDDPTKVIGRLARAADQAKCQRARRLRAQCRLLVRQPRA